MKSELWFPFKAVSKQRPRLGRRRKAFTPQRTKDFEDAVAAAWTASGLPHYEGIPICMEVDIHKDGFMVRIQPAECSVRPVGILGDLDNMLKSISDGLNGVAFKDDKQIELVTVGLVGVPRKGTDYASQLAVSSLQTERADFERQVPPVVSAHGDPAGGAQDVCDGRNHVIPHRGCFLR